MILYYILLRCYCYTYSILIEYKLYSLIDDMRWLNLAAAKTKVVNKRIQSLCVHPIESKLLILAGSIDGTLGKSFLHQYSETFLKVPF